MSSRSTADELVTISLVPGPSVFLVITGEGELLADSLSDGNKKAKEGDVFFVPAYIH
jgi:mannose-6-phosphate isomerase